MSDIKDFVIEDGIIKEYKGHEAIINIPDGVIAIGENAFHCCRELIRINIPDSVKSIETMGDVKEIGDGAFDGCKALQNLTLHEGIETIGASAFYRCKKIETLEIPSTAKTIGSRGFSTCKCLKELTLNNGLQSIGWAGFKGCIALERVVLPDSVDFLEGRIGQGVFENCKNL